MKITIIGAGYVGLVTGVCFSEIGHEVLCFDLDKSKIKKLLSGKSPIFEPGLENLIKKNLSSGKLNFTSDVNYAVDHGLVQFIAVGTPSDKDGSADLSYVFEAASSIGKRMLDYKVIVNKSTVPVGTGFLVKSIIEKEIKSRNLEIDFSVASNPEFLKEGAAIDDFMRPDRIIIGVEDDKAASILQDLYAPFQRNHNRIILMDIKSAELTKYAANAMLATRISFMNELANLTEEVGGDINLIRMGIGSDTRIGYQFLYAGCGYGGSCFPKDVRALLKTAEHYQANLSILKAVEDANTFQKNLLFKKITKRFYGNIVGMHFAVWGISFKPNTDDIREAPSLELINSLIKHGATVSAYDPVATSNAAEYYMSNNSITFANSSMEALNNADALVIMTEWQEFRAPNFYEIKERLKMPIIFDGRNLYKPEELIQNEIEYQCIGRP